MGLENFPSLQGEFLSFAEIKPIASIVGAADFQTEDWKEIDFDDELVPSLVRGAGPGIKGRTVGLYSCNASMSMYQERALAFKRALLQTALTKGHNRIAIVKFDLICNWSPLDNPSGLIYTTRLIGCRLQGRTQKNSADTADPNVMEMPLSCIRIEEVDPVSGQTIVLV